MHLVSREFLVMGTKLRPMKDVGKLDLINVENLVKKKDST